MSSKGTVFIIDGGCAFNMSKGGLNHYLTQLAKEHLEARGYDVITTGVERGYNVEEEINKFKKANFVILQTPGWWMGLPWQVKKYIDEVFQNGRDTLWGGDGRTRKDPSKKYGSGGLMVGKKVMITSTWNAPEIAFDEEGQFYADLGKKNHWNTVEKAFKFCGFSTMEGFYFFDVHKNPHVEQEVVEYKKLLDKNFP